MLSCHSVEQACQGATPQIVAEYCMSICNFIIALLHRIDVVMIHLHKHPHAKLYPRRIGLDAVVIKISRDKIIVLYYYWNIMT